MVIFYRFGPRIASLHLENYIFHKNLCFSHHFTPPDPALELPLGVLIWTILAAVPVKNCFKTRYLCLLEPGNVLLMIVWGTFSYNDKLTPLKCASRTRLKPPFLMTPIFEDFVPSFLSPSASGSSLPFSETPFGTVSGPLWASFGPDLAVRIRPGGLREPAMTLQR